MEVVQGTPFASHPHTTSATAIAQYDQEASKLDKPEKLQRLAKLFTEATKTEFSSPQAEHTLAKIFARYGRVLYDKAERDVAKRAYSIAITLLTYRETPKIPIPKTLEDCYNQASMPKDFENELRALDSETLLKRIQSFSPEDQLEVASDLRWLEHCYQNLDDYRKLPSEPNDLFEKTVGLADAILQRLLGQSQNLPAEVKARVEGERFELDYNTSHYLYSRKNSNDIDGMIEKLKGLLLRYSDDPQKKSRICNLIACKTPKERTKDLYENAKTAHALKCAHPDIFEPFLHAVGKSNFVATCLLYPERKETFDELKKLMDEAVAFVNQEKGQNSFHDYYPSIWLKYARLNLAGDNTLQAVKDCKEAALLYANCPDPDIDDLQELTQHLKILTPLCLANPEYRQALQELLEQSIVCVQKELNRGNLDDCFSLFYIDYAKLLKALEMPTHAAAVCTIAVNLVRKCPNTEKAVAQELIALMTSLQ